MLRAVGNCFFTVNLLKVGIHSLPIHHTDLPHTLSTAVLEHAPGRRHMDSRLVCQGIWFLLESNPVSPQGTSTLLHLRVKKKQKYWVLAITLLCSASLECNHASEYYVSRRIITIVYVLFSIQPIFVEGFILFHMEFRGDRPNESLLWRM